MIDQAEIDALEAELASFPPNSVTARVCAALLANVPGAPVPTPYVDIAGAAEAIAPDWKPATLSRAREHAGGKGGKAARFAASSIDTGDTGLTVLTGLRSAFSLFTGGGLNVVDEAQQRADAGLKALGVAYIVDQLFEGTAEQRLAQMKRVPAGRALLLYYGAAEIALAFTAEVPAAEGTFVKQLLASEATGIAAKLTAIVGAAGVAGAQDMLRAMESTLDKAALGTVAHVGPLADSIEGYMPAPLRAAGAGGQLTDLVAIGTDTLPVYRYLTARLVAEAALFRAIRELEPERLPPEPEPEPEAAEAVADPGAPAQGGTSAEAPDANPFADPTPAPAPDANPFADPTPPPQSAANPFADPAPVEPNTSEPLHPEVVKFMENPPAKVDLEGLHPAVVAFLSAGAPEGTLGIVQPPPGELPGIDQLEAMPTFSEDMFAAEFGADDSWKAPPPPPLERKADEILDGVFLRVSPGGGTAWVVFTKGGRFSNAPPTQPPPVDWEAHRSAGNLVGSYVRFGELLTIDIAGAPTESKVEVTGDGLRIDGVEVTRADHDFTGLALDGSWRPRDGSGARWRFTADGWVFSSARGDGETPDGRYELGKAAVTLTWNDGSIETLTLYTDRKPDPTAPAVLFLAGELFDKT